MAHVRVDDLAIGYNQRGAGDALVFLHGVGSDKSVWDRQLAYFARRWRAVALDYPGYGESDLPERDLDRAAIAGYVLGALDALGIGAAHIVGLSMGGVIAQDFYRRHPDRVRSLVLAATRHSLQRHNAAEFLRLREAPLLAGKTPADIAPELVRSLAGPNASPAVRRRLGESIAALRKDSYLKTRHTVAGESAGDIVELSSVRVPTLVVCGTEDKITPEDGCKAVARAYPAGQYRSLPGLGHVAHIEDPEQLNRLIADFAA